MNIIDKALAEVLTGPDRIAQGAWSMAGRYCMVGALARANGKRPSFRELVEDEYRPALEALALATGAADPRTDTTHLLIDLACWADSRPFDQVTDAMRRASAMMSEPWPTVHQVVLRFRESGLPEATPDLVRCAARGRGVQLREGRVPPTAIHSLYFAVQRMVTDT